MADTASVRNAQRQGKRLSDSQGFEWFARSGIFARGVTYAIVGILSIQLALGDGGKATDQQGALKMIAKESFGTALLVAMAIGLAGYASWRLLSAAVGHGDDLKDRAGAATSGISYAILCATAVKIVIGAGAGSSSAGQQTGGVLGWPGGRYIVGVVGVIVIGEGLAQLYKGLSKSFMEKSRTAEMSRQVRKGFSTLGAVGYSARAVVFALIGYFLLKAAIDYDPGKAVALDGALAKLANAPGGPIALGVVAAGLVAFAAFSIADSRYHAV